MSEMVDLVIYALDYTKDCSPEVQARAAILAMQEPTTVMRLTGAITLAMMIDGTTGSNESLAVWESMIDAALK